MIYSILDARMFCTKCGSTCVLRDAIPCANGASRYGCPVSDCGGLLEMELVQ